MADNKFPKDLRQIIISHLRRIGYRNINRKASIDRAKVGRGEYRCAQCSAIVSLKDTHGDHLDPVIDPHVGFVDWNTFMERLFLGELQRLCIPCHKEKSKAENKIRKEIRKGEWEEIE